MQNVYPPDLQGFVEQAVTVGPFANENELVVEARRFYRNAEVQREELGRELREAADSLDRGEGVKVDMDEIRQLINKHADPRQSQSR